MVSVAIDMLATCFEIAACVLLNDVFLKRKQNRNSMCFFFIAMLLFAVVDRFSMKIAVYAEGKIVLYFAILIVLQYVYYKQYLGRIIVLTIMFFLFVSLIDYAVICAMSFGLGISLNFFATSVSGRMTATIVSKGILLILILILKNKFRECGLISTKYCFYLMTVTVLDFFFGMYLFRIFLGRNSIYVTELMVFMLLIVIQVLVMWIILSFSEAMEREKQMSMLELHNDMLKTMQEKEKSNLDLWSQHIHDYKNHLLYMQEMLRNQKYEDLERYIQEETKIMQGAAPVVNTGYMGIDGIVNAKYWYAQGQGIHLSYNINLPKNLVLEDHIVSVALGNLLDNAIHAVREITQEKRKTVLLQIRCKNGYVYFQITNPVDKVVDFKREKNSYEDYYHGIGLRSVYKCVKSVGGETYVTQEKDQVIAMVVIPQITI